MPSEAPLWKIRVRHILDAIAESGRRCARNCHRWYPLSNEFCRRLRSEPRQRVQNPIVCYAVETRRVSPSTESRDT